MIEFVEEGNPDLSLVDKVNIKNAVNNFVDDWIIAQKEPPALLFGNIYSFYNYIAQYGYVMPHVENWIDEDIKDLESYSGCEVPRPKKPIQQIIDL